MCGYDSRSATHVRHKTGARPLRVIFVNVCVCVGMCLCVRDVGMTLTCVFCKYEGVIAVGPGCSSKSLRRRIKEHGGKATNGYGQQQQHPYSAQSSFEIDS